MPSPSPITVRALEPDELDLYHCVNAASFGLPPDPAQIDSKREMVEIDRWYLVECDGEPCGGAGSFATELTIPGGAVLSAAAVSDVGVLATHRRRGALSALMRRQLTDLRERGQCVALLHASEARIYRRYGYGTATRWRQMSARTERTEFREDWPDPGGRTSIVPRADARELCASVHDRARLARPGGLARNEAWWNVVLGDVASYLGGDPRRLLMLHHDDDGIADGYAIYQITDDWSSGQAEHDLEVWELIGVDTAIELDLWRVLLGHDLVSSVSGAIAPDHPLFDVVTDPRQVRTELDQDLLWIRLLDLERALVARTYVGEGSVVFDVFDPLFDDVTGRYLLEVGGGTACCERTEAVADLTLGVGELGSCFLGGNSFRRLVRAGQVAEHTAGAAMLADGLFAVDPSPWCWVRF